jgi:uncharacterized protein YgbK (DUF1537 family)
MLKRMAGIYLCKPVIIKSVGLIPPLYARRAYHGMPVIIKAGAFGDENTLCCSMKLLVGQR